MRARAVLLLATAATLVVCQAQDLRNSINTRARRVRVRVPLTTTTEAVPPEDEPSGGRRTRVRLVGRKRVNSPQPPSEQPPRVPQRNDDQSNGRVEIHIVANFLKRREWLFLPSQTVYCSYSLVRSVRSFHFLQTAHKEIILLLYQRSEYSRFYE